MPAACAANSAPNSQPEPMIEVSDAQVAPIKPISRFRPTSVGTWRPWLPRLLCYLPCSIPFPIVPRRAGATRVSDRRVMQVSVAYALSENIVEIRS